MNRTVVRRRGVSAVALACLAIGAFACGATLGDEAEPAKPGRAETLSPRQLTGERIVVGVSGTSVGSGLKSAVRAGRVAGVVLFAENFPAAPPGLA